VECDFCKIFLPPEKHTSQVLSGDKKALAREGLARAWVKIPG